MANDCLWKAYVRGENAGKVVDAMCREAEYMPTGNKVPGEMYRFVEYKNLNRKHRKYIDGLNDMQKIQLLQHIKWYIEDPELKELLYDNNIDESELDYWVDNFPGLVIKSSGLVDEYEYVTKDGEPHMIGVFDVDFIENADDIFLVYGACRWSIASSMINSLQYRNPDSPYALNLPKLMRKYGTDITMRSVEPGCDICEIIELNSAGEFVQEEYPEYHKLFDKDFYDFDDEDDFYKYVDEKENEFFDDLEFIEF